MLKKLALGLVATLTLVGAAQAASPADPFQGLDPNKFEGLGRDSDAAWSYGWNSDKKSGSVVTMLVQMLYETPTVFPGSATPVAYSIHTMAIDCSAKTVNIINGANYAKDHTFLSLGATTGVYPWSEMPAGFQALPQNFCPAN